MFAPVGAGEGEHLTLNISHLNFECVVEIREVRSRALIVEGVVGFVVDGRQLVSFLAWAAWTEVAIA